MKTILHCVLASLCFISGIAYAELTAKADQLYSYLYADLEDQPILRVCVQSDTDGEKLTALQFKLEGEAVNACLKNLSLYRSGDGGSCGLFSLNTPRNTEKSTPMRWKMKRGKSAVSFTGSISLKKGNNFFWLVADTSPKAPGASSVDAELSAVRVGVKEVDIKNGAPEGAMRIYPFYQRIAAYYRCDWLMKWVPNLLTEKDFSMLTEIYYFNVKVDGSGNIIGGEDERFLQGIEKLKKLRGNQPVDLILGFAGCNDGFAATAAHAGARQEFARQLAAYLEKHDLDGVDLDWEYPTNDKQWLDYAYLVYAIREEFGANGKTVSAAVNMNYMPPRQLLLDQLDYVNIMCYDRGGEHATMAHYKEDIKRSRAMIPDIKIIMGLPFYSNNIEGKRDWNAQTGYSGILEANPRLKPSDNTAVVKGSKHYFNGPRLISDKSKLARQEELGGVMVWAYDCDIDINKPLSLRRAMFKEIRRRARP